MQVLAPREPGIASLPRRAAAATVNATLGLAAVVGAGGLVAVIVMRRENFDPHPAWLEDDNTRELLGRWMVPLAAAFGGLAVAGRNWRSPGMRLLGLRRVDAATRGPVSIENAIIASALTTLATHASRIVNQPAEERYEARRRAANAEIEQIRKSRKDPESHEIADDMMDALRRQNVGCGPLLWRLLARLAADRMPAMWSGRRQTLNERMARTVVIDDR